MRRAAGWLTFILIAIAAWLLGQDYVRKHPQDVPWTELGLNQPIGRFTGSKIRQLAADPRQCRNLLEAAGSGATPAPSRRQGSWCGYLDGMRLKEEALSFAPEAPVVSCPVAAAFYIFEQQVLQPAAQRHLGREVRRIIHAGSYSCRRLYNRADGPYSEHATANAFDIVGFELESGQTVSVLRDWDDAGADGAFLRDVRDGSCRLFATVLSPDYNAAHADHLHLDQADRGTNGWRACR